VVGAEIPHYSKREVVVVDADPPRCSKRVEMVVVEGVDIPNRVVVRMRNLLVARNECRWCPKRVKVGGQNLLVARNEWWW